MEDRIGSITLGKQADVILIRTDDLGLFPSNHPLETILFQSSSANIDTVIIAGKIVYSDLNSKKDALAESGRRLLHNFRPAAT